MELVQVCKIELVKAVDLDGLLHKRVVRNRRDGDHTDLLSFDQPCPVMKVDDLHTHKV